MMTKEQHITYWIEASNKDWEAIQDMFKAKTYVYALYFAHLCLEKLLKAHWVKDNEGNIPKKTHNLLDLLDDTKLQLPKAEKDFFRYC